MRRAGVALLLGAAGFGLVPAIASAQSARETELEARVRALEALVASMRAELDAGKAAQAASARATRDTEARVAVIESRVAPSPAPTAPGPAAPGALNPAASPQATASADGFRSGATTIKIGGFLKTVATFSRWDDGDVAGNALGRDFYLPQQIPVGGARESTDSDFSAKQTRLWLTLSTPVGASTLGGYVETDFQTSPGTQGSERTTNGYNLALRRAYLTWGGLLAGQDWSTFQYVGALPETTDFIGVTEGTVFVRQPQVRYSHKLASSLMLAVAVENPETATSAPDSTALVEQDDDRLPDLVGRLVYTDAFGEFSLAGIARELSAETAAAGDRAVGWGASLAGKIPFGGKRHDLRLMATYGEGIGRYVGLNFAPDAVYAPATGRLDTVENFAAFAAVRFGLTPTLRTTLMGSYQSADYPAGLAPPAASDSAWSAAANLFWTPVAGLDLGVEYRHGERELLSGAKGQLDRLEFAAKYGF